MTSADWTAGDWPLVLAGVVIALWLAVGLVVGAVALVVERRAS